MDNAVSAQTLEVTANGVGIGTATPVFDANSSRYLSVDGGSSIFGSMGVGASVSGTNAPVGQFAFFNSSLAVTEKRVAAIASFTDGATNSGTLQFYTFNAGVILERMRVDKSGNVGIGTTSPSYKLQVAGTVRATNFISDTTTYADSVFKPDYRLASLSEVETAIQRQGHLPEIPSEAEAKRDGIDMARMQVQLLQKVEELTLYAITQQKQIETLQHEVARLKRAE